MRLNVMNFVGATDYAYGLVDTTQRWPLGTRARAIAADVSSTANTLNGGGGDFIYCKSAAATPCGTPVTFDSLGWVATAVTNTAGLGRAAGIAANRFTAADQFGWVQLSGQAPVVTNGTFAAGAQVYIQAAGVLSTTQANGKQLNGAWSIIAAAAAITKTVQTTNGATQLLVPNIDGLFCGLAVSGTGIAASTIIDIDPGGKFVVLSAAMTANGTVTGTFTYTNLGAIMMNNPFYQGQVA